ncbi:hypothetical protein [Carboxylicivirga taeanensis]|uniref:hypothetical protein n=1 Tax=Carboxylicivirga taeanensis TaxID=1416875 RepID=UPI003F6DAAEC
MKRNLILSAFLLALLTLQAPAQEKAFLSAQGQQQLWQIYQTPLAAKQSNFSSQISSIEQEYLRLYSLFIAYQASEEKILADQFFNGLDQFEKAFETDDRFKLMLTTLLIQQSLINWNNEAFSDGLVSFYKAHRLFTKTDSTDFTDNHQKLKGIFRVFFKQIPEQYQFWTSLFGLNCDASDGLTLLKKHINNCHLRKGELEEALVLYSYCLLKFGNPTHKEVMELMDTSKGNPSPILAFTVSSLAVQQQMASSGIKYLHALPDSIYPKFPLLYYNKGRLQLNQLNKKSLESLQAFRTSFSGQSFQTDALLRRAWWHHIHQNTQQRDSITNQILQQKRLPTSNDKQAVKEAPALKTEPAGLLKARLLFDGGDFEQAHQLMLAIDIHSLSTYYHPEYHYRLGRISHALNKPQMALNNYRTVIELCQSDKRYIGPYAALEAASITIELQQVQAAKNYLRQASELNNGQYKSDIKNKISALSLLIDPQ